MRRLLTALPALCVTLFAFAAGKQPLTGVVVDADGKPVADAIVSGMWDSSADKHQPLGFMSPYESNKTGADGRFNLKMDSEDSAILLMAIDANQQLGGLAVVDPNEPQAALSIRLAPLIEVRGRFSCDELKGGPGWTNVYIAHSPTKRRLLTCEPKDDKFVFKLPPGKYDFDGYGNNVLGIDRALTLTPDKPVLDLGTIDLRATGIAKNKGKAPPAWNITDARGIPKTVQYSDLKGKWVLLEFWGHW